MDDGPWLPWSGSLSVRPGVVCPGSKPVLTPPLWLLSHLALFWELSYSLWGGWRVRDGQTLSTQGHRLWNGQLLGPEQPRTSAILPGSKAILVANSSTLWPWPVISKEESIPQTQPSWRGCSLLRSSTPDLPWWPCLYSTLRQVRAWPHLEPLDCKVNFLLLLLQTKISTTSFVELHEPNSSPLPPLSCQCQAWMFHKFFSNKRSKSLRIGLLNLLVHFDYNFGVYALHVCVGMYLSVCGK